MKACESAVLIALPTAAITPVVIPGTDSRAEEVPAERAVKSDVRDVLGRPASEAAGMTFAGTVVVRRFSRMVT